MSFDSDPDGSNVPSFPGQNKIDTQESAGDRQQRGATVRIDYDLCEATGVCADVCPEDVLEHDDGSTKVVDQGACTECWFCVENCTSGAIEVS